MTVLLVLLTIGLFLSIDLAVNKHKWELNKTVESDIRFDENLGFLMADGGEKIEEKK